MKATREARREAEDETQESVSAKTLRGERFIKGPWRGTLRGVSSKTLRGGGERFIKALKRHGNLLSRGY
jgi:hypothetical protein